jgi:hypothetical protein
VGFPLFAVRDDEPLATSQETAGSLCGGARRELGGPKSLPSGISGQRLITSMTTQNLDSLITVKNSLIAQSNSLFSAKNSLFGFLGNSLVSHWDSLPIFYWFAAWQGLTMEIPGIM